MAAYKWCGRKFSVNANTVGQEMEKLEQANGSVTAEMMVDAARPATSPLHPLFEWNDSIAAEKYRKYQATVILCALTVETVQGKETRAYVNVAPGADDPVRRSGSFINVTDALSDKPKRELILRTALRELNELQQKYKDLNELSQIFVAINQVTASFNTVINDDEDE